MSRGEHERLLDIREAFDRIAEHARAAVENEALLHDALLYQLIVIGEAGKHLDERTRADSSEVPWEKIAGLRDVIAHEYFRIDLVRIREIVDVELPALAAASTRCSTSEPAGVSCPRSTVCVRAGAGNSPLRSRVVCGHRIGPHQRWGGLGATVGAGHAPPAVPSARVGRGPSHHPGRRRDASATRFAFRQAR